MNINANSGYRGYSMSTRAEEAYSNGEMPRSKWTKSEILDEVRNYLRHNDIKAEFSIDKLSKLTLADMRCVLLKYTSWHHTSSKFNKTAFYSINEDYIDTLTDEKIEELINEHKQEQKVVEKVQPKFITAYVWYDEWVGQGRWKRKKTVEAIVKYRSTDKLVSVNCCEKKRLSSLWVRAYLESEEDYPSEQAVMEQYNNRSKANG